MQSQAATALPSLALHTAPHSRNVSDWSQFSGFTGSTDGMGMGAQEEREEVEAVTSDGDEESVCGGEAEMGYGRTRKGSWVGRQDGL